MKALITGASSGIGEDMARILSYRGYDLILVARRKKKLERLKEELSTNVEIISMDLSSTFNCTKLYNKVQKEDIDILINNAGFGVFGNFVDTPLEKELDMIDLNIKAVHTLTKLFLSDFQKKNKGYILNVASIAGFQPGPLMAGYYASKAYVLNFTEAVHKELKKLHSNVYIGVLCPGPVDTEFNQVAGVEFGMPAMDSMKVADYAIKKMFQRKRLIIPGITNRLSVFFGRFIPRKLLLTITYSIQKAKVK